MLVVAHVCAQNTTCVKKHMLLYHGTACRRFNVYIVELPECILTYLAEFVGLQKCSCPCPISLVVK